MEQAPTCSLPLLAAIGAPVKGDSDDPSPAGRAVPSAAPRRGLVKCKGGSGGGCFGDGDSRSGGSRGWGKTEALGTGSHWDTGAFVHHLFSPSTSARMWETGSKWQRFLGKAGHSQLPDTVARLCSPSLCSGRLCRGGRLEAPELWVCLLG